MHAFRRSRGGFQTRLDATERTILGRVVADVALLLGHPVDATEPAAGDLPVIDWGSIGGPDDGEGADSFDPPPTDPALARLLPPASEDVEVAAEQRRLNEATLRSAKASRLRRVWHDLQGSSDKITVPSEAAMDWAGALTDVRLVLAERLGVQDAEDAEALETVATSGADEVSRALATLYLALSWLQESLLTVMLRDLPDDVGE